MSVCRMQSIAFYPGNQRVSEGISVVNPLLVPLVQYLASGNKHTKLWRLSPYQAPPCFRHWQGNVIPYKCVLADFTK